MTERFSTHYADEQPQDLDPAMQEQNRDNELLTRKRKFHSIVPSTSVAGTSLMLVIAIMAFLASLTLGAVSLVNDTARGWQNDISREVTIQVREVEGQDMEAALIKVRQLAGGTSGVQSVTVMDEAALARLLEPWLGSGLDLNDLPVPRLVTLTIDENNPPDLEALQKKISAAVPTASLDDHRIWVDRLTTMARTTIIGGVVIFLMMMAATVMTVVFATRGTMSGNRHVIEVLHFVGAEQSFIAAQFQKHFLLLGLKGALVGGALAILCFVGVGYWSNANIADPAGEQVTALFGAFSVGLSGYVGTGLLVFFIALLSAITSRYTVFRHVGSLDRNARPQ